ncbi:MAG: thiamine phosphate synthase [Candidatus Omnitrophica bacterium]|nr:thiamine phosphate synthase [Candidatus Omnitrophota bacterium]MDD5737524.1 thiamine phosphate synthase [Candidatus Omnitrophota bacterium]
MKDFKLYVIIDSKSANGRGLAEVASEAVEGGADIIQLREKDMPAREIVTLGRAIRKAMAGTGALFIINDRPDIAAATGADGVHLGQDDLPPEEARAIIGRDKVIGVSTHSLEQALAAEKAGADYIGVGPVFATPTKPDYIPVGTGLVREVSKAVRIPFVAIGGIDAGNIGQVLDAGASRIAVVRAVCGASDVRNAAKSIKERLNNI